MIYFASDIHLGAGSEAESRACEERFVAWLDRAGRDAEAIVLLGDLFDFWFEYGRVVPKGFVRTLGRLAALTDRGVRVLFFTGNHDMWVGDYLERECGVEIHAAPGEMTLAGRRLFLAHGDNMNIRGDVKLRLLNRIFRSRLLRRLFAWGLHPDLAMRFGQWWSGCSRKSHGGEAADVSVTAPLTEYARDYAARCGVGLFVFGHMHFPCEVREEGLRIVHLGSWDRTPSCAVLDDAGELHLEMLDS